MPTALPTTDWSDTLVTAAEPDCACGAPGCLICEVEDLRGAGETEEQGS